MIELTKGTPWEFQAVVGGQPRPWETSLEKAVEGLAQARQPVAWPIEWTAFGALKAKSPFKPVADVGGGDLPGPDLLARVPDALALGGKELEKATVRADAAGAVDLVPVFGEPRNGRTAFLFAELQADDDRDVTIHVGADYWMQWWVDGESVFDTLGTGNRTAVLETAYEFPLCLARGRHVVAVRVISGNGGWAVASEATRLVSPAGGARPFGVRARRVFQVADPGQFASLTFVGPEEGRPRLGGREIPVPIPEMRYRTVPAVPVSMLEAGPNALEREWDEDASVRGARVLGLKFFHHSGPDAHLRAEGDLFGLEDEDARIQTGPILNHVGADFFTLTCRTNMPVAVRLEADGAERISEPGLFHRFKVGGLGPGAEHAYRLAPCGPAGDLPERARAGRVRTLPPSGPLEFVMLGDSATHVDVWEWIARRVAARRPHFAVFSGDMVSGGCSDAVWDERFFGRAPEFFSSVPFFVAAGNHEENSALFERLFMTPGGGPNWAQEAGNVLLVGIDGAMDWSPDGPLAAWLDQALADSRAGFIFLFNHYPAWSSAVHGRLGPDGLPVERPARAGREVILPLLVKHRATAVISGHDHCYERSELPGGLTAITSGGAGSYLYTRCDDPRQNPYSRVFASAFHFCFVRAEGDTCTMEAVTPEGEVIDTQTWKAREAGGT